MLFDEQTSKTLAKTLTMMCVRNSYLEDLHSGHCPITKTGDYSDVKVIDAEGREIPWSEVSRLNDDEMKTLMKGIVDNMFTWFMRADDPAFSVQAARWQRLADQWDEPVMRTFKPPSDDIEQT